jgi:hypothetical protein
MEDSMKSEQHNASLMWPSIIAVALFGMLAFMIVADPAAEQPITGSAQTTN